MSKIFAHLGGRDQLIESEIPHADAAMMPFVRTHHDR